MKGAHSCNRVRPLDHTQERLRFDGVGPGVPSNTRYNAKISEIIGLGKGSSLVPHDLRLAPGLAFRLNQFGKGKRNGPGARRFSSGTKFMLLVSES